MLNCWIAEIDAKLLKWKQTQAQSNQIKNWIKLKRTKPEVKLKLNRKCKHNILSDLHQYLKLT